MENKVTFQYNKQQNCPIVFSHIPWHPPNPQVAPARLGVKYYRYKTTHGYLKILMCTHGDPLLDNSTAIPEDQVLPWLTSVR